MFYQKHSQYLHDLCIHFRTFVLWNPPLKRKKSKSFVNAENEKNSSIVIENIFNEKSSTPLISRKESKDSLPSFNVEKSKTIRETACPVSLDCDEKTMSSSIKSFLDGCEIKPNTLGMPSSSLPPVSYPGGWRRKPRKYISKDIDDVFCTSNIENRENQMTHHFRDDHKAAILSSDEEVDNDRRSSIVETAFIFASLMRKEIRALAFCKVIKILI